MLKERIGNKLIKVVLMDLDDTILDFKMAEKEALKKTLTQIGVNPTEEVTSRYSQINELMWKELEKGLITRSELLTKRFRVLFEEIGVKASDKQAWNLYESYLSQGHYFVKNAIELLEILKEKYKLYIVSNGTATVQDSRIKSANIAHYFEEIFISQRIGVNKPDVKFFDYCFNRIPNVDKDEIIIVGDSLSSDIKGGINAGLHTCWFNLRNKSEDKNIVPEYVIYDLLELPNILENIG